MIAPSLTWHIDARTQVDVDVVYQDDETANDYGLPGIRQRRCRHSLHALPGRAEQSFDDDRQSAIRHNDAPRE